MAPTLLWLLLGGLLLSSACFSASETALFSLSPSERQRAGETARRLLDDARALLVAILLGNLVINVLFFAFAARLAAGRGAGGELAFGLGALVAIVLFGEVFPKSLALRGRIGLARVSAVPLVALVALTRPVQRAADGVLELTYRLIGKAGDREHGITTDQLSHALELSARQGVLLDAEADILVGVAELQEIRVREIMTPRVDVVFLDLDESDHSEVLAAAVDSRIGWLIAMEHSPDRIAGKLRLRDVLTANGAPLRELVQPVEFVPEVASAFDLLHLLRERRAAEAVVVDEWGGTAGLVRLEDVFEEIVGELRVEGERDDAPVQDLGGGRFLVVGSLAIRDWNEAFGHRVVPIEFETVGGFVTALLERMPRPGDTAGAGGLEFEVREVERHRITTLEIRVAEDAS
jgi:CBS domain containing-hemolysin-like protein